MKRIYSLMFALTLCTVALNAQYFTEDFEAGLPAGWELTGEFSLTDAATISSQYFAPDAHTQFVGVNDDALAAGGDGNSRMTTSVIDLTAVTGDVVISMESFFINGDYDADETAKVYASTDMGANWEEVGDIPASTWGRVGVLFPYSGQEVMVAFEYADGGGWNYGWCIDDILIEDAPGREVAWAYWNEESYFSGGFEGGKGTVGGVITNNGTETLTSIDLIYSDGTNSVTETITGLDIAYNESAAIQASAEFTLAAGTTVFSISVGNANGMGPDEDISNDAGDDIAITTITPNPDRGVLVEEATGTWCPWCTRGTVFVEGLTKRYPEKFIGVAVHNEDPMAVAAYDDGIGGLIGGYPSSVVERGTDTDPSQLEAPFASAVQQAPPARLAVGAINDGGQLTVSVGATFLEDVPVGYKLAAILIENGVTGTGTGFNQANAYGGGGNGPMGGYELVGGTIAAADIVYNHVGRALIGGWNGDASSITTAMVTGELAVYNFPAYSVSADINLDNSYLIGVLLDASNKPVNAVEVSYDEALANGEITSTKNVFNHNAVSVFPNPFAETATINVSLESSATVTVEVVNTVGQVVSRVDYGTLTGNQNLTLDGTNLNSGVYFVHVRIGDELATKRVTIAK
jgi:hypothetical protein